MHESAKILLLMLVGEHTHRLREEPGLLEAPHFREIHLLMRAAERPCTEGVGAPGELQKHKRAEPPPHDVNGNLRGVVAGLPQLHAKEAGQRFGASGVAAS